MAAEGEVDVVEIERVRHRTVEQRRLLDVGPRAAADHGRLRRTAILGDLCCENVGERFMACGQGHAEEIHETVAGDGARFRREVLEAEVCRFLGESGRDQDRLGRAESFAFACRGSHGILRRRWP
jgi:hypothetical protein